MISHVSVERYYVKMEKEDIDEKGNGKISILMGIYNCASTLREAVDSIIAQTYTNWELIFCDDCSTDDTYQIAEYYKNLYPEKIILLRNKYNSKLAFTLNRCIEVATGEFVARMDGDDISMPNRFEKQINYLRKHPDVVLVGTAMQRFSDDGSLGAIAYCKEHPDYNTPYKEGLVFNHATIVAYRYVFEQLGGYTVSPRTVRGQDRDLWYRFLVAGYKGSNIMEPLYMVRENEDAIRRRSAKDRWISFKTEVIGYSMLHYKWYRYAKPIVNLMKVFVPIKVIIKYREWQSKKQKGVNK